MDTKKYITKEAQLANKQVHSITDHNTLKAMADQIKEMSSKIAVLEGRGVAGRPIGSRWPIVSHDKPGPDLFETNH